MTTTQVIAFAGLMVVGTIWISNPGYLHTFLLVCQFTLLVLSFAFDD